MIIIKESIDFKKYKIITGGFIIKGSKNKYINVDSSTQTSFKGFIESLNRQLNYWNKNDINIINVQFDITGQEFSNSLHTPTLYSKDFLKIEDAMIEYKKFEKYFNYNIFN